MSASWAQGLKVAELRDELKKRNIEIGSKALKAALLDRLLQALEEEDVTQASRAQTEALQDTAPDATIQAATAAKNVGPSSDESAPSAQPASSAAAATAAVPEHSSTPPPDTLAACEAPPAAASTSEAVPVAEPNLAAAPSAAVDISHAEPAPKHSLFAAPVERNTVVVQQAIETARVAADPKEVTPAAEDEVDYDMEPEPQQDTGRRADADATTMAAGTAEIDSLLPGHDDVGKTAAGVAIPAQGADVELQEALPTAAPTSAGQTPAKRKRSPIPLYQRKEPDTVPTAAAAVLKANGVAVTVPLAPVVKPGSMERAAKQAKLDHVATAVTPTASQSAAALGTAAIAPGRRGLYIGNLVRPFTEGQLRELISVSGQIADLWMPSIKTHAVAVMADEAGAVAAANALAGLQWPASSAKRLTTELMSVEDALHDIQMGRTGTSARGKAAPTALAAAMPTVPKPATSLAAAAAAAAAAATLGGGPLATARRSLPLAGSLAGRVGPAGKLGLAAAGHAAEGPEETVKGSDPADVAGPGGSSAAAPVAAIRESSPEQLGLDQLFRKTTAKPAIYYLPLTDAEVAERKAKTAAAAAAKQQAAADRAADGLDASTAALPPPPRLQQVNGVGRDSAGRSRDRDVDHGSRKDRHR